MQKWAKWFADKGHEVHLITSNSAEIRGVTLHLIGTGIEGSPFNFLKKTLQARKLVRKIKPDILHAHYVFGYGTFGAFANYHPFVVSAWGSDILIDAKESILKRQITKYVLKKTDLITCDADHMKKAMIELGTDHKKIFIIYFGIDTKKFSPQESSEKIREAFGMPNSPVIISLRNLEPLYDVKSLITAIPLVLKESPEAKFVIAGRGSQEVKLKELAKSLEVSDSIRFVGFIPNDELPKYLIMSNIYVSTSLSDAGIAASTAEAMACGLPVVITDFGDNRNWVEDGVSGFIVPLKDPKTLAERINYLLENEDIRKEFGMRNRKIIEDRNNYYKEMEKMESIYIELVERYKS
jgi:glycosyltransferase involved in cell wall biosynthesis